MYVGNKRDTGNPVERAGLQGGALYGIKVTNGGANYGSGPVMHGERGPINGTFVLTQITDPLMHGNGRALQTRQ